jgi:hypothetical protein
MIDQRPWVKSTVGVLGTVGAWHRWARGYSLAQLGEWLRRFQPDLVCADIERCDWETGSQNRLSLDYRACLVPLCRQLGITIVPVGNPWPGIPSPLRMVLLVGVAGHWINLAAVDRWHQVWAGLWPGARKADRCMANKVLSALRRDPGRRVLATVRIERRYAVVAALAQNRQVRLVQVPPPGANWAA